MNSRDVILSKVRNNQPPISALPELTIGATNLADVIQTFIRSLGNIGGTAIDVQNWKEVDDGLQERFSPSARWISMVPQLKSRNLNGEAANDPRSFENISVAILPGEFAVAENGAVWITDARIGDRVLPFICEHLVLVINASAICETMQHAYERIGSSNQNFGTFIAGPSKTADIEQSLVLGAHGPKTLTVFLVGNDQ